MIELLVVKQKKKIYNSSEKLQISGWQFHPDTFSKSFCTNFFTFYLQNAGKPLDNCLKELFLIVFWVWLSYGVLELLWSFKKCTQWRASVNRFNFQINASFNYNRRLTSWPVFSLRYHMDNRLVEKYFLLPHSVK